MLANHQKSQLAALRAKRYRDRIKSGKFLVVVEIDHNIVQILNKHGFLKDYTTSGLARAILETIKSSILLLNLNIRHA